MYTPYDLRYRLVVIDVGVDMYERKYMVICPVVQQEMERLENARQYLHPESLLPPRAKQRRQQMENEITKVFEKEFGRYCCDWLKERSSWNDY
jgi:hypothetical protein